MPQPPPPTSPPPPAPPVKQILTQHRHVTPSVIPRQHPLHLLQPLTLPPLPGAQISTYHLKWNYLHQNLTLMQLLCQHQQQ